MELISGAAEAGVVSNKSSALLSMNSKPAFKKSKKLFSDVELTGVASVTINSVAFFASGFGSSGSGPNRIEKKSNGSSSSSILRELSRFWSPISETSVELSTELRNTRDPAENLLQSYRTAQHSPRGTRGVQPFIAGAHFLGVHFWFPRMQKQTWQGSWLAMRSPSG